MYTISDLKQKTKEKRLTYSDLSLLSGVPEGSLKQLFSGRIPNPGYDTVCAIVRALGLDREETVPEYAQLFEALSDYHKGIALAYMRGLLAAEGKEIDPIKNSVILQK